MYTVYQINQQLKALYSKFNTRAWIGNVGEWTCKSLNMIGSFNFSFNCKSNWKA